MSRYRILEKKGQYILTNDVNAYCCAEFSATKDGCENCSKYIPRFIVQEFNAPRYTEIFGEWVDLKEFTSLEEARAYKRDLELEDGIIIE